MAVQQRWQSTTVVLCISLALVLIPCCIAKPTQEQATLPQLDAKEIVSRQLLALMGLKDVPKAFLYLSGVLQRRARRTVSPEATTFLTNDFMVKLMPSVYHFRHRTLRIQEQRLIKVGPTYKHFFRLTPIDFSTKKREE